MSVFYSLTKQIILYTTSSILMQQNCIWLKMEKNSAFKLYSFSHFQFHSIFFSQVLIEDVLDFKCPISDAENILHWMCF